jgi:hypothetical protein
MALGRDRQGWVKRSDLTPPCSAVLETAVHAPTRSFADCALAAPASAADSSTAAMSVAMTNFLRRLIHTSHC